MKSYAAILKDNNVRENSSSGGVFSCISKKYDVVYGVAMTEDCYGAEIRRIEGDISSLRGSKYIQAKVGDAFKLVKKDLLEGKKVLFSGTGCQINGLSLFLGKDYPNLFLLDIICHGVPSPKLWREYAKFQEKKLGKINKVNFRCKDDSWLDYGLKVNKHYALKEEDPFMSMFLGDYCLRPSCYECKAKQYRKADITLGDFWGIGSVTSGMDDGRGTSLVLVRTEKGENLFDIIKSDIIWKEVSYEESVNCNPSLYNSSSRPIERDVFFQDLGKLSFDEMIKKYANCTKIPFKRRAKSLVKRFVNRLRSKKDEH